MQDNNKIRFSVIIPAYNAAQTISRAVTSCLNQSYKPHELIIVNDCSTDDTDKKIRAIMEAPEYTGYSFIYKTLEKNSGPARARNAGLELATGNYIAFQDADDNWHRDKLLIMQQCIAGQPDAAFIFHPYTLGSMDFDADEAGKSLTKFPFRKLLWSNPIGTPCVIMSSGRSFRFDETMRHMEDFELWLRAGRKRGVWFYPVALTQINRPVLAAGGLSGDRWEMRKGEFIAYLKFCRRYPLYYLILPALVSFGIIKHLLKSFRNLRSGY